LLRIGGDTTKPKFGDYVTVGLTYATLNDSVFFEGTRRFQLTKPDTTGSIEECILMLSKGEKAIFILSSSVFFQHTLNTRKPNFLKSQEVIKVTVSMKDIQSDVDYKKEKKAFLAWIRDFGEYERLLLTEYLTKNKIDKEPVKPGLYYIPLKKGNDKKVEIGDTLVFHYEGRFLNGKYFDSTKDRNQPFYLIYGNKWQVIEGIEKGIGLMHEGERALFIMESNLAFGKTGSTTGLIPPYTPLIYEVEILEVNKKTAQ
jgi:FKBP-type peptidyl-prolyl cis-trans isomerase